MAQHTPIKEWMQEKWYGDIIKVMVEIVEKSKYMKYTPVKNCEGFFRLNHFIEQLSDEFLWKEKHYFDSKVLNVRIADDPVLYAKYKDVKLDEVIPEHSATNDIKVGTCTFEIHLDDRNHIQDIYLPL